jgi:hypothetical protein
MKALSVSGMVLVVAASLAALVWAAGGYCLYPYLTTAGATIKGIRATTPLPPLDTPLSCREFAIVSGVAAAPLGWAEGVPIAVSRIMMVVGLGTLLTGIAGSC